MTALALAESRCSRCEHAAPPEVETCATCLWFQQFIATERDVGYCRKNAPTSYVYRDGTPAPKWPKVASTELCGKWRAATGGEVDHG